MVYRLIFTFFLIIPVLIASAQENTGILCADGLDNDGDGQIDCDDPDCIDLPNEGCVTCLFDGLSFADKVIEYEPTCLEVLIFKNPRLALGVSDNSGDIGDEKFVGLGDGGMIKLGFVNNLVINSGDDDGDIWVFEIGNSVEACFVELQPYDPETENALLSQGLQDIDGDGYYEFGSIAGATSSVDIDEWVPGYNYGELRFDAIKLVDSIDLGCGVAPGAEIDAVCALSSILAEICSNGLDDDMDGLVDCDDPDLVTECCCAPIADIDLGGDMTICPGESVELVVDTGYSTYQWQDGSEENTLIASIPGTYSVTVTDDNGCAFADSISVDYEANSIVAFSYDLCAGSSIEINGTIYDEGGTYYDTLVGLAGACDTFVEYTIDEGSLDTGFLGPDQVVCAASTELISPYARTRWSDGSEGNSLLVESSGTYIADALDENDCPQSDTVAVDLVTIGKVYLPTAFSPNNDGINDVFGPQFPLGADRSYELTIYNRWGAEAFRSAQPEAHWDGQTNGKDALSGIYVYLLKVDFEDCAEAEYRYGSVSLIR